MKFRFPVFKDWRRTNAIQKSDMKITVKVKLSRKLLFIQNQIRPLSLVEIEPIEEDVLDPGAADVSANIKQETDSCDLESIIDIEEDLVLKTEPSDLTEFINDAYE